MQRLNSPSPATESSLWLFLLCGSRFGASLAFMMYAGALGPVMQAWSLSAGEAGTIQTAFNAGYALSLVMTSWLADSLGAKRVFLWSGWLTALIALALAVFARSYGAGLALFTLLGLAKGGTYGPSIMLVAQGVPPARRGAAVGWTLGASSLGYFASIALSTTLAERLGYETAFLVCGAGPAVAAVIAAIGMRTRPNRIIARTTQVSSGVFQFLNDRRSLLLTAGYTTHCWELLGMWAWMPTFLNAVLAGPDSSGIAVQSVWIAAAIHLSGCLSSLTMGKASDRFGRRRILLTMGCVGALCSFTIGWTVGQPMVFVLLLATLYGFSALGDSSVLSAAMTESVEAGRLGTALAVRSILGFGAGGLAPLAFGHVLDHAGGSHPWGWGFALLGIGGALAALCAALLPKDGSEFVDRSS
jgi:MFS family permease